MKQLPQPLDDAVAHVEMFGGQVMLPEPYQSSSTIARLTTQLAAAKGECERLRYIASHVPSRIYMKAREECGLGVAVVPMGVAATAEQPLEIQAAAMRDAIKTLREYVATERDVGDGKVIGLAYQASQFGPCYDPSYEPYELLEKIEKWLHAKCDEILSTDAGEKLQAELAALRTRDAKNREAMEQAAVALRKASADWSELTDDQYGKFPGAAALAALAKHLESK